MLLHIYVMYVRTYLEPTRPGQMWVNEIWQKQETEIKPLGDRNRGHVS